MLILDHRIGKKHISMIKKVRFQEEDPPIARDYIDILAEHGSDSGLRGWKSDLARDYCKIMEDITGEEHKLTSVHPHINRILNRKANCTLQSFLTIAWILGFKVQLVPRKEIKRKTSIDQVA
jgi:hypothetical protein